MSAALTLLLAGTFLLAAAAKLRDPAGMAAVVRRSLGPRVPARPVVRAVAVAELAAAVLLLGAAGSALPAVVAAVLLVAFSAALRVAADRAPQALATCHCFGAAGDAPPGQALLRNGLLVAGAAAVAAWPPGALWSLAADELVGGLTVAVGLVCAWQLATLAWRLRPGALA